MVCLSECNMLSSRFYSYFVVHVLAVFAENLANVFLAVIFLLRISANSSQRGPKLLSTKKLFQLRQCDTSCKFYIHKKYFRGSTFLTGQIPTEGRKCGDARTRKLLSKIRNGVYYQIQNYFPQLKLES